MVAPMFMLLIVPTLAGAIVTEPVPLGLNVTLALAGLNVVVLAEVNALTLNVPIVVIVVAAGLVPTAVKKSTVPGVVIVNVVPLTLKVLYELEVKSNCATATRPLPSDCINELA